MNIQPINNTVTKNLVNNQISFKEADFIEDYVKTPYEQEMDSLYKQTQNQIEFLKKGDADNGVTTTTIRNNDEQFNF